MKCKIPSLKHVQTILFEQLAAGNNVIINMFWEAPDQIIVWDWLQSTLYARNPNVKIFPLHIFSPSQFELEIDATLVHGAASYFVCISDLYKRRLVYFNAPKPDYCDLVTILRYRCRDIIRHHGLLLSYQAQLCAFNRAIELGSSSQALLCNTFDLIDQAVLAHRQDLLSLAQTQSELDRISHAFATIALAIERITQKEISKNGLRAAIKSFQTVINELGGPKNAALIGATVIEKYSTT